MKRLSAASRIEQVLNRISSASRPLGRLRVAERLEHPLHPLGVVLVHLAAEGRQVVALHRRRGYRRAGSISGGGVGWRHPLRKGSPMGRRLSFLIPSPAMAVAVAALLGSMWRLGVRSHFERPGRDPGVREQEERSAAPRQQVPQRRAHGPLERPGAGGAPADRRAGPASGGPSDRKDSEAGPDCPVRRESAATKSSPAWPAKVPGAAQTSPARSAACPEGKSVLGGGFASSGAENFQLFVKEAQTARHHRLVCTNDERGGNREILDNGVGGVRDRYQLDSTCPRPGESRATATLPPCSPSSALSSSAYEALRALIALRRYRSAV